MTVSTIRYMSFALLGCLTAMAWGAKHDKPVGPPPTLRIPSEPLGYHPLSSFYVMGRTSSSSLDFVDNDHVLFTFRVPGLLKRLPECQPDDEDQLIRALVLHLPDGKIVQSAEWRMHDRGRYLWPLGDGRFLVRQQDGLLTTDASLELTPFLKSSTPLRLVKLSPDAHLLLVETDLEKHTPEEHESLAAEAKEQGLPAPREDVQLVFFRIADRSVVTRARSLNVGDIPLISDGYIESLAAHGDHWMIRYVPFDGQPSVMADVESSCKPNESSLNARTAFVSICPQRGSDHEVDAVSLDGKKLWNYRWDDHYIWPTLAASENGQRVAFSTLRVGRPVSPVDPIDETDLREQRVEVMDVLTGRLELTEFASPILSGGQNYALSPDGSRFAVLRENAIEVYDLPPAAALAGSAE